MRQKLVAISPAVMDDDQDFRRFVDAENLKNRRAVILLRRTDYFFVSDIPARDESMELLATRHLPCSGRDLIISTRAVGDQRLALWAIRRERAEELATQARAAGIFPVALAPQILAVAERRLSAVSRTGVFVWADNSRVEMAVYQNSRPKVFRSVDRPSMLSELVRTLMTLDAQDVTLYTQSDVAEVLSHFFPHTEIIDDGSFQAVRLTDFPVRFLLDDKKIGQKFSAQTALAVVSLMFVGGGIAARLFASRFPLESSATTAQSSTIARPSIALKLISNVAETAQGLTTLTQFDFDDVQQKLRLSGQGKNHGDISRFASKLEMLPSVAAVENEKSFAGERAASVQFSLDVRLR